MGTQTMKTRIVILFVLLAVSGFAAVAQEAAKPKPDDRTPSVTPLRVQVLLAEFDGEKKVLSLPFSFTVNADERRARPGSQIRNGARMPVSTGKDQLTYIDVGNNVDCSATQQEDGRFKLQLSIERSYVSPVPATPLNPIVRQFRVELNPVLKDGQSIESVVSTDPLSGHVYHVSVILNVLK